MDNTIISNISAVGSDTAERVRQLQSRGATTAGLSEKQRQQAKKISQDFEGLFIGMMVKAMHDTVGKDTLTGGGHGEEVFRSLLDQEYTAAAVKRGGFGLAKLIEKEIIQQESRKIAPTVDSHE